MRPISLRVVSTEFSELSTTKKVMHRMCPGFVR